VTLVPAYSIAKTFTAAALLIQHVDLSRTVGEFLEVPETYQRLTLASLLNHTSGLGDYFQLAEYRDAVEAREDAWSDEELLQRGLAIPTGAPGEFAYSNIGYALVRKTLEHVGGGEFFDVLSEIIFTPLEMFDVHRLLDRSDWSACAGATESVRAYDPKWVYPRTFLADPKSLASGFAALIRGELCDSKPMFDSVDVFAPGHSFKEPRYGLGLMLDGNRYVGHGGGGPGFALFALARPDGSAAHVEWIAGDARDDAALISAAITKLS
jgi:D-alanyl-D-alanine carboxypeptidase